MGQKLWQQHFESGMLAGSNGDVITNQRVQLISCSRSCSIGLQERASGLLTGKQRRCFRAGKASRLLARYGNVP